MITLTVIVEDWFFNPNIFEKYSILVTEKIKCFKIYAVQFRFII